MNNKLTKTMVVGLVAILVLSLGAVAAFAQDDAIPDTDTQPALPYGRGGFAGPRGHHGFDGRDDETLAAALGITVEELQAARQKAAAERLAQAVEDGYLTQDQANTMLAMMALHEYIDRDAIMAQVLGLSTEELQAAREDGTLFDLLADITPADLQEKMQAAMEASVAQAVADNVITQDQAELVLEQMANGAGMMGKFGGHHGFGGHGGFRGFPGAAQGSETGEAVAPFAFGA
jgi:hypothetical protein